jgi:hypothetical protein
MECPFCQSPMQPGSLRSRGYATVWAPEEAGRAWMPPPFDSFGRRGRHEEVVAGSAARSASRCDSCGAIVIAPDA